MESHFWKTKSKFQSHEISSVQFVLLSLTEHSNADGSVPIDSEASDQENYFKNSANSTAHNTGLILKYRDYV